MYVKDSQRLRIRLEWEPTKDQQRKTPIPFLVKSVVAEPAAGTERPAQMTMSPYRISADDKPHNPELLKKQSIEAKKLLKEFKKITLRSEFIDRVVEFLEGSSDWLPAHSMIWGPPVAGSFVWVAVSRGLQGVTSEPVAAIGGVVCAVMASALVMFWPIISESIGTLRDKWKPSTYRAVEKKARDAMKERVVSEYAQMVYAYIIRETDPQGGYTESQEAAEILKAGNLTGREAKKLLASTIHHPDVIRDLIINGVGRGDPDLDEAREKWLRSVDRKGIVEEIKQHPEIQLSEKERGILGLETSVPQPIRVDTGETEMEEMFELAAADSAVGTRLSKGSRSE